MMMMTMMMVMMVMMMMMVMMPDDIDDDDDANAVGGNMLVQVQVTSGWRLCATCAKTLRNNMCKDIRMAPPAKGCIS